MNSTILLCFLTIGLFPVLQAQDTEQFRRGYQFIAIYDPATETWSDWEEISATFVFNANLNNDIYYYAPDGSRMVFRRVGNVQTDYNKAGDRYQELLLLDEEGDEILLILYDFGDAVLWLSDGTGIQFSN